MLLSDWLARYQALVPAYFLWRVALLMGLGLLALICVMFGVHGKHDSPDTLFFLNPLAICSWLLIATMMLAHMYLLLVYPMRELAAYPRRVDHPLLLCMMTAALTSYVVFVQLAAQAGAETHLLLSASAVVVGGLSGLSWGVGISSLLVFNGLMTVILPPAIEPWFWGFMLCAQWVVYVLFKALIGEFHTKTLLFQRLVELQATQRLLRESVAHDIRYEIARNLHDEIGHLATRLSLTLARMGNENAVGLEAQALTRELHQQLRSLASSWSGDGRLDVKSAIEALVQPISRVRIALEFNGFDGRCAPAIAEAIFRACQEGITNCLRHSDASLLTITLEKNHQGFQAELQDNGKTMGRNPAGNGLIGIESRVRQLGGRMEYGAGTNGFRLAFTLPDTCHAH